MLNSIAMIASIAGLLISVIRLISTTVLKKREARILIRSKDGKEIMIDNKNVSVDDVAKMLREIEREQKPMSSSTSHTASDTEE